MTMFTGELTARHAEVKDRFAQVRGTWGGPAWEAILRLNPEFLDAYVKLSAVPLRKQHLDPVGTHLSHPTSSAGGLLRGPGEVCATQVLTCVTQCVHYRAVPASANLIGDLEDRWWHVCT